MNLREWARATHRALSEQREEGHTTLSGDVVEQVLRAAINTLVKSLLDGGELRIDALGMLWVEVKEAWRVYGIEARRMMRSARQGDWLQR